MNTALLTSPRGSLYTSAFFTKMIDNQATLVLTETMMFQVYKPNGELALEEKLENVVFGDYKIMTAKVDLQIGDVKYIFRPNEAGQIYMNDVQNFFRSLRNYKENPQQIQAIETPDLAISSTSGETPLNPQTIPNNQSQDNNEISKAIVSSRKNTGVILIFVGILSLTIWLVVASLSVIQSGLGALMGTWYLFALGIILIIRGFYERR